MNSRTGGGVLPLRMVSSARCPVSPLLVIALRPWRAVRSEAGGLDVGSRSLVACRRSGRLGEDAPGGLAALGLGRPEACCAELLGVRAACRLGVVPMAVAMARVGWRRGRLTVCSFRYFGRGAGAWR